MALHDFQCPTCGFVLRDHNVPIAIGAKRGAPTCPKGAHATRMSWLPKVGRMDAGSAKSCAFTAFDTFDTFGRPVRVDNFHGLRQLEAESERAHRNGEGQLLRWRDLAMDRSNRDQSSIATHMDRAMDDQDVRQEAGGAGISVGSMSEGEAEQIGGEGEVIASGGDYLGEG